MSVFIPFFFVEFGIGFRDIQAFTEHCFTMAGTKRENRVTSVDIYKKELPEAMLDTQPPQPILPFLSNALEPLFYFPAMAQAYTLLKFVIST